MNKNIIISIVMSFVIIFFTLYFVQKDNTSTSSVESVYIKDGIQYVTINARGGYYPKNIVVQKDIPTKLIIKTKNTYDCSSAISIPSLSIRKMLKPTGEEVIDLGSLESGKTIDGTCSMGMYSFKIQSQ